MQINRLDILSI